MKRRPDGSADAPESRAQRRENLLIALEIEQLCTQYWSHVDALAGEAAADLFVEDGRLCLGPTVLEGREAICKFLLQRDAAQAATRRVTRHVATNYRLVSIEGDRAIMASIVAVYAAIGNLPQPASVPSSMGNFEDVVLRDIHGDWRFANRTGTLVFAGTDLPKFLQSPASPT